MTDATIADGPSDEALRWAKVATLDTFGCTLAGAHEDCARIVGRAATFSCGIKAISAP